MAEMGRPTIYSDEVAEKFCERISQGRSMRSVCADKDMPSRQTIGVWLKEKPDFSYQYEIAVEERGVYIFEDVLRIVDGVDIDKDCIAKARLQMDARKWFLSKLLPKKFGDKITDGGTDNVDATPITVNINVKDASKDA